MEKQNCIFSAGALGLILALVLTVSGCNANYVFQGDAKYAKSDYAGAIADYTEAIKIHPSAEAYYKRGFSYLMLGDWTQSVEDIVILHTNAHH